MLSSRTLEGRMYMLPDRPEVNRTIVGVVARGQDVYAMTIHGAAFVSNHFHMVVTGRNPEQVAGFMQYVKANLTRRINAIRGRSGTMWHQRYDLRRIGRDDGGHLRALGYVLAHGAKEGLVRRPEDWPGVSSAGELLRGGAAQVGVWGRGKRAERTIELTPLPELADETESGRREALVAAVDAALERAEVDDPGADAARKIQQGDWQATVEEPKKRRADSGRQRRADEPFREAFEEIVARYKAAAAAHVQGDACVFPPWTFPRWQRMGGRDGLRFGGMLAAERREWQDRKTNGVYRQGRGPPPRE